MLQWQLPAIVGLTIVGIGILIFIAYAIAVSRTTMPRKSSAAMPSTEAKVQSPTRKRDRELLKCPFPEMESLSLFLNEQEASVEDEIWETEDEKLMYNALTKVRVLAYLEQYVLRDMIKRATRRTYYAGEVLFQGKEYTGSVYVVASGKVTIHRKDLDAYKTVREFECVNTMLMVLASMCGANDELDMIVGDSNATADTECEIIEIGSWVFKQLIEEYPVDMLRVTQIIISKLDTVTAKALVHYFDLTHMVYAPVKWVEGEKDVLNEFGRLLGCDQDDAAMDILRNGSSMVEFEPGKIIHHINDTVEFVHVLASHGWVEEQAMANGKLVTMHTVEKGHCIGMVSAFTKMASFTQVMVPLNGEPVAALQISATTFRKLLIRKSTMLVVTQNIIKQYANFLLQVDAFFDWVHLESGKWLTQSESDQTMVFQVLSGRIRTIVQNAQYKKNRKIVEFSKGESINTVAMIAEQVELSDIYAIRDTQVSVMPKTVFNIVVKSSPKSLLRYTKVVSDSLLKFHQGGKWQTPFPNARSANFLVGTIAIIPCHAGIDAHAFGLNLRDVLHKMAPTSLLSSSKTRQYLGPDWFSPRRISQINLCTWLGNIENCNEGVIYEADVSITPWWKLCVRQADQILLLCDRNVKPNLEEYRLYLNKAWKTRNVKISIVSIGTDHGGDFSPSHGNVCEDEDFIRRVYNVRTPLVEHPEDIRRLSRRVTGTSIGLVLGGGGARGLAHLGVIKALEEAGINVDIVGGTSIGAFIAAVYAKSPNNFSKIMKSTAKFAKRMSSIWEKLLDLTFPITSVFNGSRFNYGIRQVFGDMQIQDLYLNYFCVTTDLANSRTGVHRTGSVWKYVRASMSLQGYLPPISDGTSLLLDGGYMNILPADIMSQEGVRTIIAVDVGKEPNRKYHPYGNTLSGWWLLLNKLRLWGTKHKIPSMGDISASLAFVSSMQHRDHMKSNYINLYLKPPVGHYSVLQFDKMDEIVEAGYIYAKPLIKNWLKKNPVTVSFNQTGSPRRREIRKSWTPVNNIASTSGVRRRNRTATQ